MSRTMAKNLFDKNEVLQYLQDCGVEVIGRFTPKTVRMCGDEHFQEVD